MVHCTLLETVLGNFAIEKNKSVDVLRSALSWGKKIKNKKIGRISTTVEK